MMECAKPLYPILGKAECQSFTTLMGTAMAGSTTSLPDPATLDLMCASECLADMRTGMIEFAGCIQPVMNDALEGLETNIDMVAAVSGMFDFICLKNDASGTYCVSDMAEFANMQATTPTGATGGDLDSACASISSLGCCMTSLFDYTGTVTGQDLLADFPCTNLPPACVGFNEKASYKSVTFQVTDDSLANALFQNDLITAIRKDISAATGVPIEHISVNVTQSGNTATVTVTVRGEDDTMTKTYDLSGLSNADLSTLAAELGVASLAVQGDVTVQDGTISGAKLIEDTTSAAFAIAPAAAALLAVVL
jgi:hypothetical protein